MVEFCDVAVGVADEDDLVAAEKFYGAFGDAVAGGFDASHRIYQVGHGERQVRVAGVLLRHVHQDVGCLSNIGVEEEIDLGGLQVPEDHHRFRVDRAQLKFVAQKF